MIARGSGKSYGSSSKAIRLETQEKSILQMKYEGSLLTELRLARRRSTDWMRPTHIMEYLKYINLNVSLTQTLSHTHTQIQNNVQPNTWV
jgi:hypothetical protein